MNRIVVAAALINAHQHVLVQRRRYGGAHGGLWEFPGGKPEAGEGLSSALVRELSEELAIAVSPADLTPLIFSSIDLGHEKGSLLLLLYLCHIWAGDPLPLAAEEVRWVSAVSLAALEMPPADVPLVASVAALLG